MKQLRLFPISHKSRREDGGHTPHAPKRRRRRLSTSEPLHLVLKSDYAQGKRQLVHHTQMIHRILRINSARYRVSIYEKSIHFNHIHLLVRGKSREEIQNFFRVVAGHIAQRILENFPIPRGAPEVAAPTRARNQDLSRDREGAPQKSKPKRENKFWETSIYSRILSWGKEFHFVKNYLMKNTLRIVRTTFRRFLSSG